MKPDTLPPINATLNAIATVLLIVGILLIKRGKQNYIAHGWIMASAFAVSSAFLVLYLLHKVMFQDKTSGLEPGALKNFYLFVILIPHVILAIVMVPMILTVLVHAYRRRWDRHRRLARWTYPIWLYVSVTGVIIYWMLYHLFPRLTAA